MGFEFYVMFVIVVDEIGYEVELVVGVGVGDGVC